MCRDEIQEGPKLKLLMYRFLTEYCTGRTEQVNILQDFNMVKIQSRPQTNESGEIQSEVHPDSNLLELWRFGSENYSGKRSWSLRGCGFESHQAYNRINRLGF